ncbi:MAG TPA: N-acetylmuramoyl-L-alanine amidase, partial [Gemmatimonadales bacterium]|nr:N-acetylmuramoyl-L-alanine amidase [Gemmatimonadales bacterium]
MHRRILLIAGLGLAAPAVWAAPTKKPPPKPKLIALDPGHGGHDPGALGYSGTKEKSVVITVARDLVQQLQAGKYRVMLTRASDTYVPLRERVARAQDAKADLFLSIHADSHPDAEVRGASVYTLSEEASDREAAALAARENRGDTSISPSSTIARTLVAMAQRGTVNDSRKLADAIVGTFGKSGIRLLPHTHRQAGFAVLTSPDIPAALV